MKKRHILLFLLAVAAISSCVYDFDPQIDGEGGYLIVEGNIIIGEESEVSLNYSWSLVDTLATQDEARMAVLYRSKMHVEDSKGGRYENKASGGRAYGLFDMRDADPSLKYRLVIENDKGTYASAWEEAQTPGEIDNLSFEITPDRSRMYIKVSCHAPGAGPSFYRWRVNETWEYHSDIYSYYSFVYTGPETGEVVAAPDTVYRCWLKSVRGEILTGSTEGLTEDRLVDFRLYTIANTDERISVMYAADITQMRIPEEAYRYWQLMDQNMHDVGGLFSPEPTEFRGNVANVDRPEEMVLGYVGVMSVTRKRLYVHNLETQFYRSIRKITDEPDTLKSPEAYVEAYRKGKVPTDDAFSDESMAWLGYIWWPVQCVDCRFRGGHTRRPPEWPIQ